MAELPSKTTTISRYAVQTSARGILRSHAVRRITVGLAFALVPLLAPARADAADRLCDTRFEDCRAPLISLINSEPAGGGIDVAFWFMTDDRYRAALQNALNRGVRVRVLVDPRADATKAGNAQIRANLAAAGIPIRQKVKVASWGDILHWKLMYFEKGPNGKPVVGFSAGNFSSESYVPVVAYKDYIDEVVYITDDPRIAGTFAWKFENYWTDTSGSFTDYANVAAPYPRYYPVVTQDPALNFPPTQNYANRAVSRYDNEPAGVNGGKIDVIMYRISQDEHADGMIRAIGRGIPVRLITEEENYRDARYIWHSYNVDRMWAAGVDVKQRYLTGGKAGITHQKSVILYGQKQVIFGSSNWSSASATQQFEHNLFSAPCTPGQVTWCDGGGPNNNPPNWFFNWFVKQFDDKWNSVNPYNFTEFLPFKPRPGGTPVNKAPANGAVNVGTSGVVLKWDGGNWNHKYDVYLSQTSNFTAADKIASDIKVGSPYTGQIESWTIPATITLQPGTTYFWRVVGKTMADSPRSAAAGLNLAKPGPTWSFTTAGTSGSGVSTPYTGTPVSLPGTIQAENFDNGGSNVAYRDTTPGNSGGKYRSTDVDIASTTDTGGGYNIGYTVKSEFLKYTVNVGTAGTYTLRLRYANVGSGAKVRVSVNGTNVTFALQDTGGWQVWGDLSTTIPLSAGTQVLTLWFDERNVQNTAAGNINYLSIQ